MASPEELIRQAIDQIARSTGTGDITTAYANMLYGPNHRGLGNPIKTNHDNSGITFFTRPDLNLTYDNLAGIRPLTPLVTTDQYTLQRAVRAILDPRNASGKARAGVKVDTPLIDNLSPFINLLSNNLLSLSGWPDQVLDFFESKAGVRKETFAHIDSHVRVLNSFTLSATFKNIDGDPISLLLGTWLLYMASVYVGDMVPYNDHITYRRIDYNTRVYHFSLDPSRRFVTKTFATGASFFYTNPVGAAGNFNADRTYQDANDQITTQIHCMGMDYNDPITISEFNRLVGMFNPAMRIKAVGATTLQVQGSMFQLKERELIWGNYRGYPLIHPYTNELFWFVTKEQYDKLYVEGYKA